MRSLEITIFLILIAPSLTLINAMHIFDSETVYEPSMKWYEDKDADSLQKFELKEDANVIDYAMFVVTMAFQFIFWALQILLTIVWLAPMLSNMLGLHYLLSGLLTVGVWVIWVIGIIQVKHAVSFDGLR